MGGMGIFALRARPQAIGQGAPFIFVLLSVPAVSTLVVFPFLARVQDGMHGEGSPLR